MVSADKEPPVRGNSAVIGITWPRRACMTVNTHATAPVGDDAIHAGPDAVALVVDERAAACFGHNRPTLAIGEFTLVGDLGADGDQGCVHRAWALSGAVPVAHQETSLECREVAGCEETEESDPRLLPGSES